MTKQGLNGHLLDLDPARVEVSELPANREAQIQSILKSKSINKGGGMFKSVICVANGDILIEARKRHIEMEKKAKEAKEQK